MDFSEYVWSLYRESESGQELIKQWEDITLEGWLNNINKQIEEQAAGEAAQLSSQDADSPNGEATSDSDDVNPDGLDSDIDLVDRDDEGLDHSEIAAVEAVALAARKHTVTVAEEALRTYEKLFRAGIDFSWKQADGEVLSNRLGGDGEGGAELWIHMIKSVSIGLTLAHPNFFLPYLFERKFHRVQRTCEEFGIPLPMLPGRASMEDRALYYFKLNIAFQEFRRLHELSTGEMFAFLYDFADTQIGAENSELPPPGKAWLLLGGAGGPADFEYLDAAEKNWRSNWQGNRDTRNGDICIMYCVSPRKYVHSIWRAVSDGFSDPFFWYYTNVWIGHPIKVPHVTFGEMASDPVLSQKPVMRAHLQGASGKAFTTPEYDALLKIFEHKGFDTTALPRLQLPAIELPDNIQSERDVEDKLIEPLFQLLGYSKADWVRQMRVQIGRRERVIPDYVFGAVEKRGEETGKVIWEAKFRLSSAKEHASAYVQLKSYALRLQAKFMVLAAVEGLWLYEADRSGFRADSFIHKSWQELKSPDAFREVALKVGRQAKLWSKTTS
jgi:hypothetical protein